MNSSEMNQEKSRSEEKGRKDDLSNTVVWRAMYKTVINKCKLTWQPATQGPDLVHVFRFINLAPTTRSICDLDC